jgi:hypothetical protein
MTKIFSNYHNQVFEEVKKTPLEYLPALLQLIRVFRESITLKSAEKVLNRDGKKLYQERLFL